MKVVIFACVLAAVVSLVAGAPMHGASDGADVRERVMFVPQSQYRGRRSHFGPPAYAAPCGAAALPAIAPAPAYLGPLHGGTGYGGGGYGGGGYGGGYGGGHGYGYAPHYRADDAETDILNLPDMDEGMSEHLPMARYSAPVIQGGPGIASLGGYGALAPAVAAGPAYGVFPNANHGGCNVPLLLSCSPSIVPGRLVKGYGGYGSAVPAAAVSPAYRGSDDHNLEHEENPEEPAQEHLEPAEDSAHSSTH